MADGLQWQGVDDMMRRLDAYKVAIQFGVRGIAWEYAAIFEAYAKQEASWVDRTANARQSLHTWVEETADGVYRLYLSGGVSYQIFLETRFASRYAIIWPTIQRHLPAIQADLQKLFS
jgi:hypothetical protein